MIARALKAGLWTLSLGSILLFALLGARRLFYPLELDCIEGLILDHAVRLSHGQPIYVEPSLQFISLAYMPLFIGIAGALVKLFGAAFWVPRSVSLLATWMVATLIGIAVYRETRSRRFALAGASIYLMGFGFAGSCYDVARPDSLMLALTLGGLVVLRSTDDRRGAVVSGLLFTLAFYAKQHAVAFALVAMIHLAWNERPRLLPFAATVVAGCGGGYALLSLLLGPWFSFYTWDVPTHWSSLSSGRVLQYLGLSLVGTLGVSFVAWLLSLGLGSRPWTGRAGLWTWTGVGAVLTGLWATLDAYAYRHTLMPTMVAFSILGPISLHRLALEAIALQAEARQVMGVVSGVLALQFLPLVYPLHTRLPHPRAAEARAVLLDVLRRQPGEVMLPYHGYYEWSAGKPTSLHIIALDDVIRARGNRLIRRDPAFFDRMFEPLRSGPGRPVIVTDVKLEHSGDAYSSGPLWMSLAPSYRLVGDLGWATEALRPVTGNDFAPRYIYVPVEPPTGPASGQPVAEQPAGPTARRVSR